MSCPVHPVTEWKTIGLFPVPGEARQVTYARWALGNGWDCTCRPPQLQLPDVSATLKLRLAQDAAHEPSQWWWISFVDASRPKGTQFLGTVIVRGRGVGWACHNAHALGINPGGEAAGFPLAEAQVPPQKYRLRLLSRSECEQLDAEMMRARA